MLHLSLALFGEEGFEQMLRALRKNVFRSFETQQQALASVNSGESSMMPGLITLAAWQNELQHEGSKLDFKLFSEGSFLYSEGMGIATSSPNSALAGAFIDFVLRDSSQKMVIYKLGLFPANRKTILPPSFSRVPISPWMVNNKLSKDSIRTNSSRWLESWSRIFAMY
jgi:ABC-type thiamine transport system substrate-binding protein